MIQIEFSIDDVIGIWKELAKNQNVYHSIFDNEKLYWLKEIHKKSGAVVTLFSFYECSGFDLSMMPECYKREWVRNSNWLKIGFHGKNESSDYIRTSRNCAKEYQMFREQVLRFAGEAVLSDSIKLHRFAGTEDVIDSIQAYDKTVRIWLCADDLRNSYGVSKQQNFMINLTGQVRDDVKNLYYKKTAFRIEKSEILSLLKIFYYKYFVGNEVLYFFTHECYLQEKNLQKRTYRLLNVLVR